MRNAVLALTALVALFVSASSAFATKAVFAGGCFWCMEADFEKLEGVTDVVSGFTGGMIDNPTYNGNHSGHYEAVEITYDPSEISYERLLEHFWKNIDPFDDTGQFCDKGHSYLSAIFVANAEEDAAVHLLLQLVLGLQDEVAELLVGIEHPAALGGMADGAVIDGPSAMALLHTVPAGEVFPVEE